MIHALVAGSFILRTFKDASMEWSCMVAHLNAAEVAGNYQGRGQNFSASRSNSGSGVRIEQGASNNMLGGLTAASRNLISGNDQAGVLITRVGTNLNSVLNNWIGTDTTGTQACGQRQRRCTHRRRSQPQHDWFGHRWKLDWSQPARWRTHRRYKFNR